MIQTQILVKVIISVVYGLAVTLAVIPLSKKLILTRSEDPVDVLALVNKKNILLIALACVAVSVCMMFTVSDMPELVRDMLLILPMLSISIVDSLIRKIPNPLLLVIIVIQGVYLGYICISGKTAQPLIMAAFGFFIGFIGCTIPSILKIPVGAGDIKYSAVIGLCVYFAGYLQSMIAMGLLALVFLAVLKITKKGGMKTLIPMGPFLSVGTVITMCFPLLESITAKLNVF